MAFENFLRTDVENTTKMKSRVLTLFQKNHPAHTTRELVWKEFESRIVAVNHEEIVPGGSSKRVETERSENLIPIAYVNTFYERFMAGILSFDNDVEVPQKDNPFLHYNVQKTICEHADFLTFMNLARVNKPFKRICRILPKPVTKIKLVPGRRNIAFHIFDEKINDWVIFKYVPRINRCTRMVNGRKDVIYTQQIFEVFTKDFIFLVSQLGKQKIEEFIFDHNLCDIWGNRGWHGTDLPYFKDILAQIHRRISARKLSLVIHDINSYTIKCILIIMQYLDPECLEILRFEPAPIQEWQLNYIPFEGLDVTLFAETEQWMAARRLEWFPDRRFLPEFRHLTGFETVETSSPMLICENEIEIIKAAFLQVPPTNTFTLSSSMLTYSVRNDIGIFKFPIRDSNRDLVISHSRQEQHKITVTTEER